MAGDGLFVKFSNSIMKDIEALGAASSNIYVQAVAVLISGAVTLYILWVGYQTLAGKIQTPIQDVMWNLAKMAVIFAFIDNSGGYLTAALDAAQGFKDGLSGNDIGGVWGKLDTLWAQTQNLADTIFEKDTDFFPFAGGLAAVLVWAGSLILMATSAITFFAADMTMIFLGLTAPLFIFCLMFGFLRTMFNNWLQLIFSSILTVMFASLVINIGMAFMKTVLAQVTAQAIESNLITMGALACMAGVLTGAMVLLAAKFATQIAGVGMEGAVQGMTVMGLSAATWGASKTAAAAAGQGIKFGKGAGKGFSQGGEAKTNSAAEWAGKQSGRVGGAGYKAGKAMAKQAVENMKARYQK